MSVAQRSEQVKTCVQTRQTTSQLLTSLHLLRLAQITATAAETDCDNCPIGKISPANATACEFCVDGKFSQWVGRPTCQTCAAGKYSNQDADCGADSATMACCRSCAAGKTSVAGGACVNCPDGKYSLEGDSYCYTLPNGEQMWQCPPSSEVNNACGWYYIDDFTNSQFLPNENDASPFGTSCANYTVCAFSVVDNSALDSIVNIDKYVVMCDDCATDLGYTGIGTVTGTVGEVSERSEPTDGYIHY